ncbi:MAG: hypothetical protein Q8R82_11755 [Hyphomonadaceae bacterium]|nr:hypothetical protein [Hyphomonadaceae bacterium]
MMKKATLQFLQRERDELMADIRLLESGARDVIEIIDAVSRNVTSRALTRMRDRLGRFEEIIAAYEARLA